MTSLIYLSSVGKKTVLSSIDTMELARVYDNLTVEDCYKRESLMAYLHILEVKLEHPQPQEQCSDSNPTSGK